MTKESLVEKSKLYLDDTSDLSTAEFSDLFDKKYRMINTDHVWEGTKAEGTATTSTSDPYVDLASDFLFLTQNNNKTGSEYAATLPVVYVGSDYSEYEVVSWSDRRSYRNNSGYAYIDFPNKRLYFTKQPTKAEAVEYDYHRQMPDLATDEEPWFPAEFHDAIYHFMVSDDFMIQQSDKAKSYAEENRAQGWQIIERMKYFNSQLVQI